MINIQRIDEVEAMIREGRHCKARHLLRDLLAELRSHQPADPHQAEKTSIVAGLLSDTLDMLLVFYHESQISLNALRAVRLLVQPACTGQPLTRLPWSRTNW